MSFISKLFPPRDTFTLYNGARAYYPIYNQYAPMATEEPMIYDADGRRIHTCFIRDFHSCHAPTYTGGRLMWDRYNFGLKHHFYTHLAMLETMGSPDYRYGALVETMGVCVSDYRLFDEHATLAQDFDKIFTFSRRLLEKLPNAHFVPFCSNVRLDFRTRDCSQLVTEGLYATKTKDVSILSSNKTSCPLHVLRIETAKKLRRLALADAYGTFDDSLEYVRAYDTVAPYRFSVVFENSVEDYCFTEKLTNCLACQTIPIYIGPPSIGEFFNIDGIIQVRPEEVDDIESILRMATPQYYNEHLSAVLDNYSRAKEYLRWQDFMFNKYLAKDFGE